MPLLSHNNHIQFGYSGQSFRLREKPEDVFEFVYGQCGTVPGSFRETSLHAAKLIADVADAPIHVLFSGGIDSEVTMRSFLAAKVPITAAIMRFHDGLNMHDIRFAVEFCEGYGVPYRFYDLDIEGFLKERVLEYTVPVRCNAPMMAATMWLVDQVDGFPVLGQGECYLMRPERMRPHRLPHAKITSFRDFVFEDQHWAIQESETINGWYRHFLLRDRNGVVGFHQYTPEQILAYLRDPMVNQMLADPAQSSSEAMKLTIYRQHFPLAKRPKLTGYERISELVNQYRVGHTQRFRHAHSFVLFEVETLVNYLSGADPAAA